MPHKSRHLRSRCPDVVGREKLASELLGVGPPYIPHVQGMYNAAELLVERIKVKHYMKRFGHPIMIHEASAICSFYVCGSEKQYSLGGGG